MQRLTIVGIVTASFLLSLSGLAESNGAGVAYPKDYRKWVHVKTTVVGPQSEGFARNGGIHHFYANDKAMEGYRTGKFPDGAILIDDGLEGKENAGVTSEGPRRRVAVMLKSSQQYRDTGGWGFEIFPGDTQTGSLNAQAKAACFACHQKAPRESVYSEYRK